MVTIEPMSCFIELFIVSIFCIPPFAFCLPDSEFINFKFRGEPGREFIGTFSWFLGSDRV